MSETSTPGSKFAGSLFIVIALAVSPIVFPRLLSTTLTPREAALLWALALAFGALGAALLYYRSDRNATGSIWLAVGSMAVSLAILEGGLRLMLQPDESLLLYRAAPQMPQTFSLKPDLDLTTHIAGNSVRIKTSGAGLRLPENMPPPSEGSVRIAFVGDSFTFGLWATSADNSFAHRTGALLGDEQYSIANLGVPGYGIEDSLLHLKHHWDALEPDIVVLSFYNGNDFLDTYLGTDRYRVSADGLLEFNDAVANDKIPPAFRATPFQLESWLKEHLFMAQAAARVLAVLTQAKNANQNPPPSALPDEPSLNSDVFWSQREYPAFADDAQRATLAQLNLLAQFVREQKQRPLLIVAVPYQEQVVIPDQFSQRYALSRPQSFIAAFCAANNIPYLDLQPALARRYALDSTPLYYHFDGHFNDHGHAAAAQAIAQQIRLMQQAK